MNIFEYQYIKSRLWKYEKKHSAIYTLYQQILGRNGFKSIKIRILTKMHIFVRIVMILRLFVTLSNCIFYKKWVYLKSSWTQICFTIWIFYSQKCLLHIFVYFVLFFIRYYIICLLSAHVLHIPIFLIKSCNAAYNVQSTHTHLTKVKCNNKFVNIR